MSRAHKIKQLTEAIEAQAVQVTIARRDLSEFQEKLDDSKYELRAVLSTLLEEEKAAEPLKERLVDVLTATGGARG